MNKLTGNDRVIADEVKNEFIERANYTNDRRTKALLERFVERPILICKKLNVSPALYVRAVLSYQSKEGPGESFAPWQISPMNAESLVLQYIQSAGCRNIPAEFHSQCVMLGTALQHNIPDYLCLLDPSLDFAPWFRVLMTAEPHPLVIEKYGKEALNRLKLDHSLHKFLREFSNQGQRLDLTRIPGYKYE